MVKNFVVFFDTEYSDSVHFRLFESTFEKYGANHYFKFINTQSLILYQDYIYEFFKLDDGVLILYLPLEIYNDFVEAFYAAKEDLKITLDNYFIVNPLELGEDGIIKTSTKGMVMYNQYILKVYNPEIESAKNKYFKKYILEVTFDTPRTNEAVYRSFLEMYFETLKTIKITDYRNIYRYMSANLFDTPIGRVKLSGDNYLSLPLYFVSVTKSGNIVHELYSSYWETKPFYIEWNSLEIEECDFLNKNGRYFPKIHFIGVVIPTREDSVLMKNQIIQGVLAALKYYNQFENRINGYYLEPYILPGEENRDQYIQGIKYFVEECKGSAIFGGYL